MRRIVLSVLLISVLCSTCVYVSREAIPERIYNAATLHQTGMEKFTHREMSNYGFRLLFIPISIPSPLKMTDAMIVESGAVGVTNLDVEYSEFNVFFFQIPKVTVRADMVREKEGQAGGK
jgi:hypothetical protein